MIISQLHNLLIVWIWKTRGRFLSVFFLTTLAYLKNEPFSDFCPLYPRRPITNPSPQSVMWATEEEKTLGFPFSIRR